MIKESIEFTLKEAEEFLTREELHILGVLLNKIQTTRLEKEEKLREILERLNSNNHQDTKKINVFNVSVNSVDDLKKYLNY